MVDHSRVDIDTDTRYYLYANDGSCITQSLMGNRKGFTHISPLLNWVPAFQIVRFGYRKRGRSLPSADLLLIGCGIGPLSYLSPQLTNWRAADQPLTD